jgi:lipopolysaccharide/colanic/teichoic acid biosynthesis glycosyltransferase
VVLLAVTGPLMLAVSVAVLATMGRPVLFRQLRAGRRGRPFVILKFRTMIKDAEQQGGGYMPPELNLITPLGSFLRRSSLDELPQLLNVLRGEMAFVGPRPALPHQVARYTERQRGRLSVPQGITGLAQVRYRNDAPWSRRIEADLEYVERLGPRTDLEILRLTLRSVIRRQGIRSAQTIDEVDDLGPTRSDTDAATRS